MDALSKRIGCYGPKVIACFRNATADDLLQAQLDVTATFESPLTTIFQPLLDNKLFTRSPYDALASGQFLRIPLMISTVLDEGNYFTITKVKDLESSIKFRRSMFKWMTRSEYAQLERIYPNDSEFHGSSQMLTDFYFACPARRLATTYAKANLPVYKTFMTHAVGVLQMFKPFGACHGSDIPFWWQFQAIMTPSLFDIAGGQERQLSKAMLDGLLDFAYGKRLIGGKGLPRWPNYTSGNALELRIPIKSVRTFKDNRLDRTCEFLDKAVKAHDGVGMGTPKFGSVMLSNIEARIATTFGWATDYFLRAVFYSE